MTQVKINLEDLKALRDHAIAVGTLLPWSDLAIEYAEGANAEIDRLTLAMKAVASLAGKDWLIGQLALAEALDGSGGKHLEYALKEYEAAIAEDGE